MPLFSDVMWYYLSSSESEIQSGWLANVAKQACACVLPGLGPEGRFHRGEGNILHT